MHGKIRASNTIKAKLYYPGFRVYVHATPEDGHCMLHALAMAIYPPYKTSETKLEIVKQIRREILTKLYEINPKSGKTNYKTISGGSFAESALWNKASTSAGLKELFSSSQQLGEEAKIILEFFIEKNILVIDAKTGKLYTKHDFQPDRSSVILYYTVLGENVNGDQIGHFELISVQNNTYLVCHFESSHPFVKYLMEL